MLFYLNIVENTFTLVRDRFGQKPLYYSIDEDSCYFASEIKSLLSAGSNNSPNFSSISEYLHKGKIDCSEYTWFENIKQIEAGTFVQIKDIKVINKVRWYNLENFKFVFQKI